MRLLAALRPELPSPKFVFEAFLQADHVSSGIGIGFRKLLKEAFRVGEREFRFGVNWIVFPTLSLSLCFRRFRLHAWGHHFDLLNLEPAPRPFIVMRNRLRRRSCVGQATFGCAVAKYSTSPKSLEPHGLKFYPADQFRLSSIAPAPAARGGEAGHMIAAIKSSCHSAPLSIDSSAPITKRIWDGSSLRFRSRRLHWGWPAKLHIVSSCKQPQADSFRTSKSFAARSYNDNG